MAKVRVTAQCSAIDPVMVTQVVSATEREVNGIVRWGDDNNYPQYLYGLSKDAATLGSCINGTLDYILGNGLQEDVECNDRGEMLSEVLKKAAYDKLLFGGFCLQVIPLRGGGVYLYHVDFMDCRTNKDRSRVWVSEDWSRWRAMREAREVPTRGNETPEDKSYVIYNVGSLTKSVYPHPLWVGAIKEAEIERSISTFHLTEINTNFMGTTVVKYNDGIPNDEQKAEIERQVMAKFSGKENAGRVLIVYANDKEHSMEFERLSADDYDKRYETLSKRSRDEIFISFRATPNLFGLPTEGDGFNSQEYETAFKLFNRTVIRPLQKELLAAIKDLYPQAAIVPFSMEG